MPSPGSAVPEMDLGARIRGELVYYDDNLKKSGEFKPQKTTNITHNALKLSLSGRLSKATDAQILLTAFDREVVEVANLTHSLTPWLSLRVGKSYIRAGGLDQKRWAFETILVSPYTQFYMPFIHSDTAGEYFSAAARPAGELLFQFGAFGEWTLQLLDDVIVGKDVSARHSSTHKQPAVLGEWAMKMGSWRTLLQIGEYDLRRSYLIAGGLEFDADLFYANISYVYDQRNAPNDAFEIEEYHSLTYEMYLIFGDFKPFLKGVIYDVYQSAEVEGHGSNHKGNAPGVKFDDNAVFYSLGCRYAADDQLFVPFLAGIYRTGTFLKDKSEPRGATQEKHDSTLKIGVTSKF